MADLENDNTETEVVDNPATEPATKENVTVQDGGQDQGGSPTEEDLFKGVDPNKLPPEVRGHYDSMLKDYREKTAKLSETRKAEVQKEVEAYRQKAELYDSISAQEDFVKQWNEYVQGTTAETLESQDPALSKLEKEVKEMKQKEAIREMEKLTDAFADAVDDKGEKVNKNFDALNEITIGKAGDSEYSLLRACIDLSTGKTPEEKLVNGYKAANEIHDKIFEAGRKAGLGRVQSKVQNGTQPPSNSGGADMSVTEKRPKNAAEALAMARRGQVVSR